MPLAVSTWSDAVEAMCGSCDLQIQANGERRSPIWTDKCGSVGCSDCRTGGLIAREPSFRLRRSAVKLQLQFKDFLLQDRHLFFGGRRVNIANRSTWAATDFGLMAMDSWV